MLALGLALFCAATPAKAAAAADQAFAKGRKLLAEGKTEEACQAFRSSHSLAPALGALLNLAECEALLGNSALAYSLYQEAEAWAGRTQSVPRQKVARARLEELQRKVALLQVEPPAGTEVLLDAQAVAPWKELALNPGPHSLIWTENGHSSSRSLELKAGEKLVLRTLPAAAPAPPPDKLAEAPRVETPARVVPSELPPPAPRPEPITTVAVQKRAPSSNGGAVGLMVGGGVAVVAGAIGLGWALDIQGRVARQQPGNADFDRPTVTQQNFETARVVFGVSVAALSVGAVAVGSGAVWLAASPTPQGGAVALGGRF